MNENDERQDVNNGAGAKLNRRNFIGALGAAAAAGALLETIGGGAKAQNPQTIWYQDSFGNLVPAGAGTLALGIVPPPVPANALPPGQGANAEPRHGSPPPSRHFDSPDVVRGGSPPRRLHPQDDACNNGSTYYNAGTTYPYPRYNILMIMVDQMRNPNFWPPPSGSVAGSIPYITGLMNKSFFFENFFVAATVCGPSRACFLTGLYTQQTCMFKSSIVGQPGTNTVAPPLLPYNPSWPSGYPGFPTIGNALSQSNLPVGQGGSTYAPAYDCTWIGKWHLSCNSGMADGLPGENGPSDYGFGDLYNIPTTNTSNPYPAGNPMLTTNFGYPSPNGMDNGGNGGDFLDSYAQPPSQTVGRDVPSFGTPLIGGSYAPYPNFVALNDASIADAFLQWLTKNAEVNLNNGGATAGGNSGVALTTPWFCAVSFINPHDITDFPFSSGLTQGLGSCTLSSTQPFCPPAPGYAPPNGYQPPPPTATPPASGYSGSDCITAGGMTCMTDEDLTVIPAFDTTNNTPYGGLPNNWNWEDPVSLPYSAGTGKPGLQAFYENTKDTSDGTIAPPSISGTGWQTFLNYYFWMQACVDYQVGRVLGTIAGSTTGLANSPFKSNTVVIFTSDHGDYGGSHNLHAKGGALYDEVMNVPLLVSYPGQMGKATLPYVCSSVDILPFIYTLALGNDSWRTSPSDIVYYLNRREALVDAIMQYDNNRATIIQERRISSIPLHNTIGGGTAAWELYQPFVLHTADDFSTAVVSDAYAPSHAIAFRTADLTDPISPSQVNNNSANMFGGGKLGIYSYWDTCDPTTAPIIGLGGPSHPLQVQPQFEFYNYSPNPHGTPALPSNPSETGNQYLASGSQSAEAALYYNDFFNQSQGTACPGGGCLNVPNELYNLNVPCNAGNPTLQAQAAVQIAFANYINYLTCTGQITGSNGNPVSPSSTTCPTPTGGTECASCTNTGSCPNYKGQP